MLTAPPSPSPAPPAPNSPTPPPSTDQAVALIAAIRTFTVEAPGGRPNGKAEVGLLKLRVALEDMDVRAARRAFQEMSCALADDTKALRQAAEGYFGGNFRKPGVRP